MYAKLAYIYYSSALKLTFSLLPSAMLHFVPSHSLLHCLVTAAGVRQNGEHLHGKLSTCCCQQELLKKMLFVLDVDVRQGFSTSSNR